MVTVRQWMVRLACFVAAALAAGNLELAAGERKPAGERAPAGIRKPTVQDVKAVVRRHLSSNPAYRPGDLIARDNVEPIIDELLEMGVQPYDDQEELYDSFLPENSFLVGALRSEAGRAFMRKVERFPGAYDRLERLSWLPEGQKILWQLISSPDGAGRFEKMCTPKGVAAMAKQLGDDPRGKNFGLPTGHIHTGDELVQRLESILDRQRRSK